MELNRQNYESFFLLYIDGELDATTKKMVEQFVAEHPDLALELDILKETILYTDDSIQLSDRASLYKTDATLEHLMLLQLDQELSAEDAIKLQALLAENPAAAVNHAWMQAAKFSPDTTTTFPDKRSLYRSGHSSRPVVYYLFRAAAVFLLVWSAWWMMGSSEGTTLPRDVNAEKPVTKSSNILPAERAAVDDVQQTHSFASDHNAHSVNMQHAVAVQVETIPQDAAQNDVAVAPATPIQTPLVQESNHLPEPLETVQTTAASPVSPTQASIQWKEVELPATEGFDDVQIMNAPLNNRAGMRKLVRTVTKVMERATGYHTTDADDPNAIRVANFAVARNK